MIGSRTVVRAAAAGILVAAAIFGVSRIGLTAGTASPVAALPRLGPIQTVDQNDVGDPFVLAVGTGVAPPTDVPYRTTGHDAYQSADWSAATAADAVAHGWYVLFGTTDWQGNVPTAISTDLTHWTQAPDALPVLPSWAAPSISMTWAPAASHTSTGWVLYYSTEEQSSHLECIGRAVSDSPAGPYTDRSNAPMLCQRSLGGSIDPSVVRTPGGAEYLVWKNDGNSVHVRDNIWSEALSTDGLELRGSPHRLLGTDQAWTHGIVEAPSMMVASRGGYWLFYAGGDWNSNRYATGLAHCTSVTGPCEETSTGPFLATTGALISPAGVETVTGPRGQLWAAFTALILVPSPWHPGRSYYNRVLDIAPILTR